MIFCPRCFSLLHLSAPSPTRLTQKKTDRSQIPGIRSESRPIGPILRKESPWPLPQSPLLPRPAPRFRFRNSLRATHQSLGGRAHRYPRNVYGAARYLDCERVAALHRGGTGAVLRRGHLDPHHLPGGERGGAAHVRVAIAPRDEFDHGPSSGRNSAAAATSDVSSVTSAEQAGYLVHDLGPAEDQLELGDGQRAGEHGVDLAQQRVINRVRTRSSSPASRPSSAMLVSSSSTAARIASSVGVGVVRA